MEAQDDQECKQEFSSFSAAALRAEAEQLVAARHLRFHLEDRQSMPGDELVLIGADRQLLREVPGRAPRKCHHLLTRGGTIEVVFRTASASARVERLDLSIQDGAGLGSQTLPTLSGRLGE